MRVSIDDYTTLASYKGGHFVSGGNPKFSDALINGGIIFEPIPGIRAYGSYAEGYSPFDLEQDAEPPIAVNGF